MRQARANVSRVLPLPPLLAAALLGVAAVLMTRLPRGAAVTRAVNGAAAATPLGWYLLGVILGPGVGLLDRGMLDACAPLLACAIGWVAARAGAQIADSKDARGTLEIAGALLVPAVALVVTARALLTPSVPQWWVIGPVVVTLAATLALAGTADPRRVMAGSMVLAAVALAVLLLPHARVTDLKRAALWLAAAFGSAIFCAGLAGRLARRTPPLPGMIAALCLGAGLGLVTKTSPLVVCGLTGFALARYGVPHARIAATLELYEPAVTALLWTMAGASLGGPVAIIAFAGAIVMLWPLARRAVAGSTPSDATLGIAIALNLTLTVGRGLGDLEYAVPTIAALALVLLRAVPTPRLDERLTSPAHRAEVSA